MNTAPSVEPDPPAPGAWRVTSKRLKDSIFKAPDKPLRRLLILKMSFAIFLKPILHPQKSVAPRIDWETAEENNAHLSAPLE